MDPVIYETPDSYILSGQTMQDQITRIGNIITALDMATLKGANTSNFDEYSLDDGQTKIKTKYRNMTELAAARDYFDKLQQRLLTRLNNQTNGRMMRLVDGKNLIKWGR